MMSLLLFYAIDRVYVAWVGERRRRRRRGRRSGGPMHSDEVYERRLREQQGDEGRREEREQSYERGRRSEQQ